MRTGFDTILTVKKFVWPLLILSRPEWGFIFSQVALMVALLYQLPVSSLIMSSLSIFLFSLGHFSLNGYYDKRSDALNPRGLSLRNPLTNSSPLQRKHIFLWIVLIWFMLIPLNILFIPHSTSPQKLTLGFFAFGIGMIGSVLYSVPPFRLKSRPFLDILGTFLIIGIFIPFYIGLLGPSTLVELNLIKLGIVLNFILVMGIHLPTMLIDIDTDQKVGDKTTAVFLGQTKAVYLTAVVVLFRVLLLVFLNLHLMNIGLLIPNWTPFILGILEIVAVYNLLRRQDQESALLLYRTIIITSGGGAVIFGLLYSPSLLVAYSL